MSLINEMLRNLEAKRPDDLARQNLQREIRSLPAARPARWRPLRLLLLSGLPLLGAAAAVLHANGQLLPLLGLLAPPDRVAVAAPPAPAASPPASASAEPGAVESAPAPTPVPPEANPAVDTSPAAISEHLRPALSLSTVPASAVLGQAAPDPVVPPLARPATVPAPVAAPLEAGKQSVALPPTGPVRIEKSPVLATARDRADADFRRAETAQATGRSGEAQEALSAALKNDPAHVPARQALLRLLLEARKFGEAIGVLSEGLELQPSQIGWAMSLARLQLEQGDLAAAEHTLARSQAHAEGSADYAGFQGHLKSRQGAHRQAASHYARATRLAQNEGRWWLGLGLAQEADGRQADAKEALRRALATSSLSSELAAVAEQHLR